MAKFSLYLLTAFLGTFKFMFAAVPGVVAGLSFFEIYGAVMFGAIASFNVSYLLANVLIKRTLKNKLKKIKAGTYKVKKNFTRINKLLVKLKKTPIGYWIICIGAPLVLSVPIGSIIVAKFYRHRKESYWISTVSLFIFGALFTYITQLIKK